ncbi:MAG: HNH endonuclease [Akkermansia sp.]|nr:HNH endonuclease [Akkermansia sp.]
MNARTVDDFFQFLNGIHATGSHAPRSYVTAIEKTNEALKRHGVFLSSSECIWDVKDRERLKKLHALVKSEQSKGEMGIFKEEPSKSYWSKGFCSAAIRDFIKYVDVIEQYDDVCCNVRNTTQFSTALEAIERKICGRDTIRQVRVRVNQYLFRKMVLDNYQHRCCVTGLSIPEVLRASHIKPWAEDEGSRLDPQNGLCLSATFDAAFDKYLISFDEDLRLIFSPALREYYSQDAFKRIFLPYEGKTIERPKCFLPSQRFLRTHRRICLTVVAP